MNHICLDLKGNAEAKARHSQQKQYQRAFCCHSLTLHLGSYTVFLNTVTCTIYVEFHKRWSSKFTNSSSKFASRIPYIWWLPSALGIFWLIYHLIWCKSRVLFCQIIHWRGYWRLSLCIKQSKPRWFRLHCFWRPYWSCQGNIHTPIALQTNLLKYLGCFLFLC